MARHLLREDVVSFAHARTFAGLVIVSILTMATALLFAAPSHDVCDAMRHACGKSGVFTCCCGDRSDSKLSQVPSDRTAATDLVVAVVRVVFHAPASLMSSVHEGRPHPARPPDFHILFSDLRI